MQETEQLQNAVVDSEIGLNPVSTEESKKRLARNTAANGIFLIFNVVTSVFMVPYQIRHLGIANYGMVTLAVSFTSYVQLATVAVTGATGRFVVFHMARNEIKQARSYVTTQFIFTIWMAIALLPVAALVAFMSPGFINIPHGQESNTQWLFFLVLLSALFPILASSSRSSLLVKQRFDISSLLEILSQTFRYSTWILMFTLFLPAIWHIGLGLAIGAAVCLIGGWIAFAKLTPELSPGLRGFETRKLTDMLSMGVWMVVTILSMILYFSIDPLIINKTLGPASVGKYGTLLGLTIMLRTLSIQLTAVLAPIAIACYARQDIEGMNRHLIRSIKFICLTLAVPLAVICGFSSPILMQWLGPEFRPLSVLMWLMFAHLVVNLGVEPILAGLIAANKLAVPAIITAVFGVFRVGLAILLIKYTNWGVYGVALGGLITFTISRSIALPIYAARVLKTPSSRLFTAMMGPALLFAITSVVTLWISRVLEIGTLPQLAGYGFVIFALATLMAYLVVLNKDDKRFVGDLLKRRKGSMS